MLASGVCHSDLHVRDGEWPRPTPIGDGPRGRRRRRGGRPGRDDAARSASPSRCRGSSRAGRAGRAGRGRRGPARIRRRSGTACRTGRRSCATRDGEPVLSLLRDRDDGRGGRRAGAAAIAAPRRRRPGRRRPHRLLRVDRGRAPCSRPRRSRPGRASRSSGSAGSGCRASWAPPSPGRRGSWPSTGSRPSWTRPRSVGATDGLARRRRPRRHARGAARPDRRRSRLRLRGHRPGRRPVELAIEALPLGGTAVLVGHDAVRARGRRSRSTRSSTAAGGSSARTTASPTRPVDFPRYAALGSGGPAAGRPAHRPADRPRRPRGRLRPASRRRGPPPGRRLRLTVRAQPRRGAVAAGRASRNRPSARFCSSRARIRSARACLIVPAATAASRSALTEARRPRLTRSRTARPSRRRRP